MLKRVRSNRRRRPASEVRRWWRIDWSRLDWRKLGVAGTSLAIVAALAWALAALGDRPVGRIVVEGDLQRVNAGDVEAAVRSELGGVGFVSVDLNAVQRAVQALPWVDGVTVMRRWPSSIALRITEQVAVARWGENDLVNAQGRRFVSGARFIPPELPRLSGPDGTEAEAVMRFQQLQGPVVGAGMHIAALSLDERGALSLTLDNGVGVRFGRSGLDARMARFVSAALPLIGQRATDIAYVDMRYSNGFAVGWRAASRQVAAAWPGGQGQLDRESHRNG